MKTSLSQLPEKKQFEINHIVEIIREVVEDVQMIVLFGSYAKGNWAEHRYKSSEGPVYEYISDYDFLVVVNKVTEQTSDQEWIIEERAGIYEPPVNLEIHEADYVNKGLEIGQYFFTDIVKDGILLFNSGGVTLAEPRKLMTFEKKQIAKEYFETWFPQANEFILDGINAFQRNSFKKAAFELHQAAENMYCATLLTFTNYKPKTHNLQKLRKKAKPHSEELYLLFPIETDRFSKHLFDLLKRGYIDARYKSSYTVSKSELEGILERVMRMKEIVAKICSKRITELGGEKV